MSTSSRSPVQRPRAPAQTLIVVVNDDPKVRAAFVTTLEQADFRVESCGSAEDLFVADWIDHAACLLLDAGLPGLSGVEVLNRLRASALRVPVVMITGTADMQKAALAMKAGACDFIEKPVSSRDLLTAIERAISGTQGDRALDDLQTKAARFMARLTRREGEVLQLILDGVANKNIAADLGISQRTVEVHRAGIMRKAGTKSLPTLTRMVFAANLAEAPPQSPPAMAGPAGAMVGAALDGEAASDRFERYFDQIPLAVVVSAMTAAEHIIYANPAFEELAGQRRAELEGKPWSSLHGVSLGTGSGVALGAAVLESSDLIGTFQIDRPDASTATVEVFSNVIIDDDDAPTYRLAALVDVGTRDSEKWEEIGRLVREKDTQLLEIQHRVKNNLQIITSLVRIEARKAQGQVAAEPFDRLAGRINSIQLIYKLLSDTGNGEEIDLGAYLSEIASSIMHSSAVEGIGLDLKVDSYPVSVNVALPTGMVVNELLTNALKHAFVGREGGTITVQSLTDADGCRVVVADDGVGLPPELAWPKRGKLCAMIVQSLRQNAKANIDVASTPGKGTRVLITFSRKEAASADNSNTPPVVGGDRHKAAL